MKNRFAYFLCGLSLLAFVLLRWGGERPLKLRNEMIRASRLMEEAVAAIRSCREARGVPIDITTDVNATGLIGLEDSSITTSLGNLEAKRTTTDPNFAGLVVSLLSGAKVEPGDAISIGASSSFPALIVASLCAARAMGVEPLLICSLGASQWGANHPDFFWIDIQNCLDRAGVLAIRPLAFSLGGEGDRGEDMSPEGRTFLIQKARDSGIPFLEEGGLIENVRERLRLYEEASGGKKIKAFINVGGGYANMGIDSEILKVGPGLANIRRLPSPERRGVIFEMTSRGIPVVHLLHIKGLCDRYGLAWDPRPLARPGEGVLYQAKILSKTRFFLIAGIYFLLVALFLVMACRSTSRE